MCGFYRRGFSPPYAHTLLSESILRIDASLFALANSRLLLRRRIYLATTHLGNVFTERVFPHIARDYLRNTSFLTFDLRKERFLEAACFDR